MAQLKNTEARATALRKEAGWVSCLQRRRGPTGGYCLRLSHPARGGNDCISSGLAALLAQHAFGRGSTVLDLGAGLGQYGRYFAEHHPDIRYSALDGAEHIEEATQGFVQFADLTDGVPRSVRNLEPRTNWVMSLEVAEHVPRSGEARFLHNVASLPTTGVVMSWASPGQGSGGGGAKHVNCQWSSYVDCAMRLVGFEWDPDLATQIGRKRRNSTFPCHWLSNNLLAFRRNNHSVSASADAELVELRSLLGGPFASRRFEDLYNNMTRARCDFSVYGACGCNRECSSCDEFSPRHRRRGASCVMCDRCRRGQKPTLPTGMKPARIHYNPRLLPEKKPST